MWVELFSAEVLMYVCACVCVQPHSCGYDGIVLKGSSLRDLKQKKGLFPNKAQQD